MPLDHPMSHSELRDLDIRRGNASMEWYRAMRAKSHDEISWEAMIEAEDRVMELDAQLARAICRQRRCAPVPEGGANWS